MYRRRLSILECMLALAIVASVFFALLYRTRENGRGDEQVLKGTSDATSRTAENTTPGVYTDSTYNFSFTYPTDFAVATFSEDTGGDTIRGEKPGSADYFEIFVSPFDEDMAIMTPERIREDLPNIPIKDPQEVVLGDGTHALIFKSAEADIGDTREVWVIRGGHVYQGVAPFSADSVLAQIIATWKFE